MPRTPQILQKSYRETLDGYLQIIDEQASKHGCDLHQDIQIRETKMFRLCKDGHQLICNHNLSDNTFDFSMTHDGKQLEIFPLFAIGKRLNKNDEYILQCKDIREFFKVIKKFFLHLQEKDLATELEQLFYKKLKACINPQTNLIPEIKEKFIQKVKNLKATPSNVPEVLPSCVNKKTIKDERVMYIIDFFKTHPPFTVTKEASYASFDNDELRSLIIHLENIKEWKFTHKVAPQLSRKMSNYYMGQIYKPLAAEYILDVTGFRFAHLYNVTGGVIKATVKYIEYVLNPDAKEEIIP